MENFKEQLNKYSKKVLIEYLIRSTDDTKREELLKIISTCKRYMESSQIIAKSDELWCYYEIAFQEKIDYLKELECKYGKEYSLKTLTTDEINKLI